MCIGYTLNLRWIVGLWEVVHYIRNQICKFTFWTLQNGDTLNSALYMAQVVQFECFYQHQSFTSKWYLNVSTCVFRFSKSQFMSSVNYSVLPQTNLWTDSGLLGPTPPLSRWDQSIGIIFHFSSCYADCYFSWWGVCRSMMVMDGGVKRATFWN